MVVSEWVYFFINIYFIFFLFSYDVINNQFRFRSKSSLEVTVVMMRTCVFAISKH